MNRVVVIGIMLLMVGCDLKYGIGYARKAYAEAVREGKDYVDSIAYVDSIEHAKQDSILAAEDSIRAERIQMQEARNRDTTIYYLHASDDAGCHYHNIRGDSITIKRDDGCVHPLQR